MSELADVARATTVSGSQLTDKHIILQIQFVTL